MSQARLAFRTGDVSGIPLGVYGAFTFGVAPWLPYGLLAGARPVIAADAVTLALAAGILGMKLRGERRRRRGLD